MTALLDVPQPLFQVARKSPQHGVLADLHAKHGGIPLPISSKAVDESLSLVATVLKETDGEFSVRRATLSFVKDIVNAAFDKPSELPPLPEQPKTLRAFLSVPEDLSKSVGYRKGNHLRPRHPLLSNGSSLSNTATENLPSSSGIPLLDLKNDTQQSLVNATNLSGHHASSSPTLSSNEAKESETLSWRQRHPGKKTPVAPYNQHITINSKFSSGSTSVCNTVPNASSFTDKLQRLEDTLNDLRLQDREAVENLQTQFTLLEQRLEQRLKMMPISLEGEPDKRVDTSVRILKDSVRKLKNVLESKSTKLKAELISLTATTVPTLQNKIGILEDQADDQTRSRVELRVDLNKLSDAVDEQAATTTAMSNTLDLLVHAVDNLRIQANEIEQAQAVPKSIELVSQATADLLRFQAKLVSLSQRVDKLEQRQSNKSEEKSQVKRRGPASVLEVETEFKHFFIIGGNGEDNHAEDCTLQNDADSASEDGDENATAKEDETMARIMTLRFTIM